MLANTSYSAMLDGSFGYDRGGKFGRKLDNKKQDFTVDYAVRLQNTTIECCDALRIIQSRNTPESFSGCNPPYVGSDQGHYDGCTQEDFDRLPDILSKLQGKFLFSSCRNKTLNDYIKKHKQESAEIRMNLCMSKLGNTKKQKTEVLTANYPIINKLKEE